MNIVFRVCRQMFNYNMEKDPVAVALGIKTIAMERELRKFDTTFCKLRIQVKRRMAENLMKQGKTIACITNELCYSDERTTYTFIREQFGMTYGECVKKFSDDKVLSDLVFLRVG